MIICAWLLLAVAGQMSIAAELPRWTCLGGRRFNPLISGQWCDRGQELGQDQMILCLSVSHDFDVVLLGIDLEVRLASCTISNDAETSTIRPQGLEGLPEVVLDLAEDPGIMDTFVGEVDQLTVSCCGKGTVNPVRGDLPHKVSWYHFSVVEDVKTDQNHPSKRSRLLQTCHQLQLVVTAVKSWKRQARKKQGMRLEPRRRSEPNRESRRGRRSTGEVEDKLDSIQMEVTSRS